MTYTERDISRDRQALDGLSKLGYTWTTHHIRRMSGQALRRGILNQHVLLDVGAFAGIVGGIVGLWWQSPM